MFDLGGGTFDLSVMQITPQNEYIVKGISGDRELGGQDFDQKIVQAIKDHYKQEFDDELPDQPRIMNKLKREAE